ncbi:beta-1,3-galactosyl-O-glycosyl-glycoprotein beta-1,6-N-acetylglucosaminyltransferase-like [Nerophis ophidion]|uniref:beta-1,3-galactosyl-O-glycosyl-glycoprotein beta-1,6-N-acetylglucosaminyltransferase-like n=1 Tax=Nerophis ophidion TaxID=159077 RepID=UPI002AE0A427|nr:beta-1,3-galactosyl-O-glycosyl-glycoprotein beta-1,6-N-acetylglucosaminyltransferase-like [Nerophis ophidion]XP_061758152.1 beta-1,3-galactosyl-O-glycosyl-glycoprotein beta-1,6-N-acetylglucosaminyltransferase-like [Nerophis ophidion]
MRRQRCCRLWLKMAILVASLCMFSLLGGPKKSRSLTYHLRYGWLDYTDEDENPEKVCDCSAILQGEREALERAKLLTLTNDFRKRVNVPEEFYTNATKDCRKFQASRKYLPFPLSQEEETFPLAYSMVVHHKVQNFERLLRAIYTPQNLYCVHVDKKASASVLSAVTSIASCFPNVFLASRSETVVYASWSRVQADLHCMADLYKASAAWKYFINLCGQDFPLKTNLEMVRALRALNGANSMESEKMPKGKMWRVQNVHQIFDGQLKGVGKPKDPPPFNISILSGNAYIVVSRGYVRSVLEDKRIQALKAWAEDTYSPDEFLWATIQRLPGVSGSTWASPKYDMSDINAIARLVKWQWHEGARTMMDAVYPECQGRHVRAICVYGVGDLQWILEQHHLFANKFDTDFDSVAVFCLEKYLRQKALAAIQ